MNDCRTCRFYLKSETAGTLGKCRRYPPVMDIELIIREGDSHTQWLTDQPYVGVTDWCGEWKDQEG